MHISDSYHDRPILTVSEITRSIKGVLENEFVSVAVAGEISNLRRPYSGHIYFTLKDSNAQIKVVLFNLQQRYLASLPEDGQEVICWGRISLYEPRGEYQIIADYLEHRQVGRLKIEFERLKNKLAMEGLFEQALKKPLPFIPERIGVVTSATGAALFDFLKIAKARFPAVQIDIYPVRVQGISAAAEIVTALQDLNKAAEVDVIVLCRGGGSLEDLMPFNDESLARAIHASSIPVVTGVGHEIDFTIADLVADWRASTPSAAAEAVIPDQFYLRARVKEVFSRLAGGMNVRLSGWQQHLQLQRRILSNPDAMISHLMLVLDQAQQGLLHSFVNLFQARRTQVDALTARLYSCSPVQKVTQKMLKVADLEARLRLMTSYHLRAKQASLQKAAALLDAVSPLGVLGRGYAIVVSLTDRKTVRSSQQVDKGDAVEVILKKGALICRVEETLAGAHVNLGQAGQGGKSED